MPIEQGNTVRIMIQSSFHEVVSNLPRKKRAKTEGLLDVEAALELLPLLDSLLQQAAAQTFWIRMARHAAFPQLPMLLAQSAQTSR